MAKDIVLSKLLESVALSILGEIFSIPFIQIAICLIIVDFLTGIFKSWISHKLDSSLGQKGCVKLTVYLFLIITSVSFAKISGFGIVDDFCLAMICLTEFTSILENLYVVEQKYKLHMPFISTLIRLAHLNMDKLNKYIEAREEAPDVLKDK